MQAIGERGIGKYQSLHREWAIEDGGVDGKRSGARQRGLLCGGTGGGAFRAGRGGGRLLFRGPRPLPRLGSYRPDSILGRHLLHHGTVRGGDGAGRGWGALTAIAAAVLLNARFLPIGVSVAPFLKGGPFRRALEGQTIVTTSWALAIRDGGRFDRAFMIGATVPQYAAWTVGTAVGVLAHDVGGAVEKLGLDAIFPAFFLALLMRGLGSSGKRATAAAVIAAVLAAALVPVAPPGVPVLAASGAALLGLRGGSS